MRQFIIMYGDWPPSREHLARLEALGSDVRVDVADLEVRRRRICARRGAILGHRASAASLAAHTTNGSKARPAGVHHLWSPGWPAVVLLLSRCPIFAETVAWHAFSLALAVMRRVPQAYAAQQQGAWAAPFEMLPSTALILGTGEIGRAVARRLRSNGLTVIGAARTRSAEVAAAFDQVVDFVDSRAHLPRACCLDHPAAHAQHHRSGGRGTGAVRPARPGGPRDVGRGGIVDQAASRRACAPANWAAPPWMCSIPSHQSTGSFVDNAGLLITPKVAVYDWFARWLQAFMENQTQRYLAGQPPSHQVA